MRIALDCANGAAYKVAPLVFEELGAEVFLIGNTPNGININRDCGALHPQLLMAQVETYRADIGIALDGDADRVILIDDQGDVVDGDQLMAILAMDLAEREVLAHNTLVATPMSNVGLEIALNKKGIDIIYSGIGDRSVVDLMRKKGFGLGGEQSGHIIFSDFGFTGDGVVAALAVLSIMKRKGKPLSQLRKVMTIIPQVLRNIRVSKKPPLEGIQSITDSMTKAKSALGQTGRLLVRYSGTEPLCRVMIEGENAGLVNSLADELEATITKALA